MASIFHTTEGYAIDFQHNGKRPRIRLGRATERQAQEFAMRLEALLKADVLGVPPSLEVAQWLVSIDSRIHSQLVRLGLATLRLDMLADLLEAWLVSLKPKTAAASPVRAIIANLTDHFGAESRLRTFDDAARRSFENYLRAKHYANATVSRRLRLAKQVFDFAMSQRSIATNPFSDVKGNGEVNHDKDFEVSEAIMARLLECCDDIEFRALLCLVRYGGVRCPSEVLPMVWSQIHWDRDRFTAMSPKTEHHVDQDRRLVPLFPKLRAALTTLWEHCTPGVDLAFPNHQAAHAENTAKLTALCKRAGIEPWPRPFKNMRATCVTEWLRTHLVPNSPYSIVDIASWAGHSPETMLKHYAQVRSEDVTSAATKENSCQSNIHI